MHTLLVSRSPSRHLCAKNEGLHIITQAMTRGTNYSGLDANTWEARPAAWQSVVVPAKHNKTRQNPFQSLGVGQPTLPALSLRRRYLNSSQGFKSSSAWEMITMLRMLLCICSRVSSRHTGRVLFVTSTSLMWEERGEGEPKD